MQKKQKKKKKDDKTNAVEAGNNAALEEMEAAERDVRTN